MRAVYGVAKQTMGNVMAQHLKQLRTPNFLATGGNTRNWIKHPQIPYSVKSVPIRPDFKPNPPENLNGREVLSGVGSCFLLCKKMGRSWSYATEWRARNVYAIRFITD